MKTFLGGRVTMHAGDCREVLPGFEADSFDSCVCDPPYLLEFMGKRWDRVDDSVALGVSPFEAWLAGFVAGEGCFRVQEHKDGKYYACSFSIHLRADDAPVLRALCERIGGRIAYGGERVNKQGVRSAPDARWIVENRPDCWNLARILDKAPLFAKKADDYRLWRRALQLWTDTPKANRWSAPRDVSEIASLRKELQEVKRFDKERADLDFDPFMPPAQAFHYTWAREVLRVMKPGAHLIACGGTRTYHRLACAIEDAGFEIRDAIMWHYGCLSDDAEILTEHGWKRGVEVREGERVAAWDHASGRIELQSVEQHTLAPYRGELVRFVNDDTDQLLTPNHRVYHLSRQRRMTAGDRVVWYGDSYEVAEAQEISRWNPVKFPVAGLHDGPGIGGVDYAALLGWIWTEGGFDKSPSKGVRVYQSESANAARVAEIELLFARVLPRRKRYDRARTYTYGNTVREYTETCWFFTGDLAASVRADLPDKRPTWDLLWRMSLAEKRAFLDAAMKGDGSGDDFYQKDEASLIWFQALLALVGQRGKVKMRSAPRVGGSVCITPRDTTEFQAKHLKQNATSDYDGLVWCVRVASGAFVARRAGKVFITGNSGFPKSHDVSKGIDRAAGVRREVVGTTIAPRKALDANPDGGSKYGYRVGEIDVTAPATSSARQWEGWGTALKPATEILVLARKPLSESTIAANVLRWGTGALNIDGCRVGVDGGMGLVKEQRGELQSDGGWGTRKFVADETVRGRFPANVIHDGSEEVLAAFPESNGSSFIEKPSTTGRMLSGYGGGLDGDRGPRGFDDSGSAARFFYSAKADQHDRIARYVEDVRVEWTSESGLCQVMLQADTALSPEKAIVVSASNTSQEWSTFLSGRTLTDLFRQASSCTIETKTNSTTTSKIWNLLTRSLTSGFTGDVSYETANGGSPAESADSGTQSLTIMLARTASLPGANRALSKTLLRISVKGRLHGHPTCKPLDLIQYLVRLVTPPKGQVLDCFAGTGTTGEAAWREGFSAVLIEREAEYLADIERRMSLCLAGPDERARESIKARLKGKPEDHGPLFSSSGVASGQPHSGASDAPHSEGHTDHAGVRGAGETTAGEADRPELSAVGHELGDVAEKAPGANASAGHAGGVRAA